MQKIKFAEVILVFNYSLLGVKLVVLMISLYLPGENNLTILATVDALEKFT